MAATTSVQFQGIETVEPANAGNLVGIFREAVLYRVNVTVNVTQQTAKPDKRLISTERVSSEPFRSLFARNIFARRQRCPDRPGLHDSTHL